MNHSTKTSDTHYCGTAVFILKREEMEKKFEKVPFAADAAIFRGDFPETNALENFSDEEEESEEEVPAKRKKK